MFKEKQLKALPKGQKDENEQDIVEYGSHLSGILEELEKSHTYKENREGGEKNKEKIYN